MAHAMWQTLQAIRTASWIVACTTRVVIRTSVSTRRRRAPATTRPTSRDHDAVSRGTRSAVLAATDAMALPRSRAQRRALRTVPRMPRRRVLRQRRRAPRRHRAATRSGRPAARIGRSLPPGSRAPWPAPTARAPDRGGHDPARAAPAARRRRSFRPRVQHPEPPGPACPGRVPSARPRPGRWRRRSTSAPHAPWPVPIDGGGRRASETPPACAASAPGPSPACARSC